MYRSAYNVHSYPYDPADLNQSYNELVTAIEGDTKYIKVIPVDPKSKNLYRYTPGVTGRTYTLSSNEMERETNPYNVYNP